MRNPIIHKSLRQGRLLGLAWPRQYELSVTRDRPFQIFPRDPRRRFYRAHPATSNPNVSVSQRPSLRSQPQLIQHIMFSSRAVLRASASASGRIATPRAALATSQIRNYAAPAAADSKPPVALYGVDGTYASALVCPLGAFPVAV